MKNTLYIILAIVLIPTIVFGVSQTLNLSTAYTWTTTATTTFQDGLKATYLQLTGATATSTFAKGVDIAAGCFAVNGTCVGGGGSGSGTVNTGRMGDIAWYAADGTVVSGTSTNPLYVGRVTATSTIASVLPYASTTVITSSGNAYFDTAGTGKVTVGSIAATYPLNVKSSFNGGNYGIQVSDGTRTLGTYMENGASGISGGTASWGTISNTKLGFFANSSYPLMVLQPDGDFGIGLDPAVGKLDVYNATGNTAARFRGGATDFSGVIFDTVNATAEPYFQFNLNTVARGFFAMHTNTNFYYKPTGAGSSAVDEFTITGAGNTGIGSSTPWGKLSVNGNSNGTTPIFVVASSTSAYASTTVFMINSQGHKVTGGTVPVVSSCGTSPAIAGNDNNGRMTIGTSIGVDTTCTVTFASPWTTAPSCFVNNETSPATTRNDINASASQTVLTITTASTFTDSDVVNFHCEGY